MTLGAEKAQRVKREAKPEKAGALRHQQLEQQQQQRAWTARRNPRAWVAEGAAVAGMPPKWLEGYPTVNSMPDLGVMFHLIRLQCPEKGLFMPGPGNMAQQSWPWTWRRRIASVTGL
ncbi:hypothetical protein GCM10017562_30200 [Streptomyces roseofulvus]